MIKILFTIVSIIGLGITTWFYYPQYQIQKMKRQSTEVSTNVNKVSYLNYFRTAKTSQVYHLAIGDSVIRGVGADQNKDLVYQFSTALGNQIHKQIELHNEGINGITSGKLNQLVQEGRFDEEIKKSDIVTINVGGNDILHLAKKQDLKSVFQTYDLLQSTFSKNLSDIVARIKLVNSHATIVFLELYNPLSPDDQLYSLANQLLPKWNLIIYDTAEHYPSSIVVETTKVINGRKLNNLSPDGVHPNSAGYTAISKLMIYQFKHQYRKVAI